MQSLPPFPRGVAALLSALVMKPLSALAAYTGDIGAGQPPSASPALPAVTPAAPGTAVKAVAAPQAGGSGSLLPGLPDVNFSWSGYFEALAVLCFVLALLWAVLWLVKRGVGGKRLFSSSSPEMRIESRLALGPKKWIFVTRCMDRRLVLGVTEQNITLLTEIFLEDGLAGEAAKGKNVSLSASSVSGGETAVAGRSAGVEASAHGRWAAGKVEDDPLNTIAFEPYLSKKKEYL